jgi:hypothetical protein
VGGAALTDQLAALSGLLQLAPYAFVIIAVTLMILSVRSAAKAMR